jgi:hypothetical protein
MEDVYMEDIIIDYVPSYDDGIIKDNLNNDNYIHCNVFIEDHKCLPLYVSYFSMNHFLSMDCNMCICFILICVMMIGIFSHSIFDYVIPILLSSWLKFHILRASTGIFGRMKTLNKVVHITLILVVVKSMRIVSCSQYSRLSKLLAEDGADNDWFGRSVSIYDNNALIGAYGDDDKAGDAGMYHDILSS